MRYTKPEITSLGDLIDMTQGGVLGNGEDGAQKSVVVKLPGDGSVADVSLQVLP